MLQAIYCIKKEKRERKKLEMNMVMLILEKNCSLSTTLHLFASKERHRSEYELSKEELLHSQPRFYFIKNNLLFRGGGWIFQISNLGYGSPFHYY